MIWFAGFWFLLGVIVGWTLSPYTAPLVRRATRRYFRPAEPSDLPAAPRPPQIRPRTLPDRTVEPDLSYDPATIDNGIRDLMQQARAAGTPLTEREARQMVERMLADSLGAEA